MRARPTMTRLGLAPLLAALLLAGCAADDGQDDAAAAGEPEEGAADQEAEDGDDASDDAPDEGGEVEIGDDCPVDEGTVSDIVGAELAAGEPSSVINDGVTCAYSHATDLDPSASVAVGRWDGAEASRQQLVEANTDRLGEPADGPDVGEHAYLWPDVNGRTTLIVFGGGTYTTTVVSGFSGDEATQILTGLHEAAHA